MARSISRVRGSIAGGIMSCRKNVALPHEMEPRALACFFASALERGANCAISRLSDFAAGGAFAAGLVLITVDGRITGGTCTGRGASARAGRSGGLPVDEPKRSHFSASIKPMQFSLLQI